LETLVSSTLGGSVTTDFPFKLSDFSLPSVRAALAEPRFLGLIVDAEATDGVIFLDLRLSEKQATFNHLPVSNEIRSHLS
jgi:hypothetical protein